jgi:hypothetical protein
MFAAALALALAAPAARPADEAASAAAMAEGRDAYVLRGDPARLKDALAAFERARTLRPSDPAPDLALARAHAFRTLAEPKEARAASLECARAAERALRRVAPGWAERIDRGDDARSAAAAVEAAGAEPLYWVAACGMRLARERGIAAVLAASDELRALMERAAALDETVDAAGPHRALGAWLAALPSAAGGGAAAARRHFDRARALAPDDQLARVREAETWAVLVQDRVLFTGLLDAVRAFDPAKAPSRAPENAVARREADALRLLEDRLF